MNRPLALFIAAALALAAGSPAFAQHPAPAAPTAGRTVSLQGAGAEHNAWVDAPQMHAFYDLSRETLRASGKVDVDAYEQKSFAIFRDFGEKMGVGAAHMQDHLKLIPRQVVQIAKEDPHVLDSYDNFMAALMGPA